MIELLNRFFLLLPELTIPDYDARGSIENLIRRTLPFIINLIRDDESIEFGTRLLREIAVFTKRFIVVLLHSLGRPGAQEYLKNIVEAIFTSTFANIGGMYAIIHKRRWRIVSKVLDICLFGYYRGWRELAIRYSMVPSSYTR